MRILDGIRPAHVSLYSLTLEPETPLARLVGKGEIVPNSAAIDEELWFTGKQELENRGYSHYEISNFCAPGKECRHNLGYWRLEPYAGAGPAAVSTLPGAVAARILERPDLEGRQVVRLANPRDIDRFLAGWEARWGIEVDVVRAADFLIENLMMGFRLAEGVPSSRIERRFGRRFEELFPGMWKRWISAGFAFEGREVLRLSEHGRLMLDGLMKEIVAVAKGWTLPPLELNWP
jgi:oxygen-independent coproporphyrinogen-3 oxidase